MKTCERPVSRQVLENSRSAYQKLSNALVDARREGIIPWEWLEDRLRQVRRVGMWSDLADFAETCCQAYRRDVWPTQPRLVEAWLEKDALSGLFGYALEPYGVTLNVGRGYDGWDSIHRAARRYGNGQDVTVLYFGDFDPSGEDMVRSLKERLAECGSEPEIVKVALNEADIERYDLPPNCTKQTDKRRADFVKRYGDRCVELDALPAAVLRDRLVTEVEKRLDMAALRTVLRKEKADRRRLRAMLASS